MNIYFDNPFGVFLAGFFGCIALGVIASIIKEAIQCRGLRHLEKIVERLSAEDKSAIMDGVKSNLAKVIENEQKED